MPESRRRVKRSLGRRLWLIAAGMTIVVGLGAAALNSRRATIAWGIQSISSDKRSLRVIIPGTFGACQKNPNVDVKESDGQVRIHVTLKRDSCDGTLVGRSLANQNVRLDSPLDGRPVSGPLMTTPPLDSVLDAGQTPTAPSVLGLDVAAATSALRTAGFSEIVVDGTSGQEVTTQSPVAGRPVSPKAVVSTAPSGR